MDFLKKISGEDSLSPEEAEVKLDLCGVEKEEALKKLSKAVNGCKRSKVASLYIRFDPARAGGGETLFQPVMRYLKVEKWNDYINYASPIITPEKAGIFVVFKD